MQLTEEAWEEYREHTIEPDMPAALVDMLKLAFTAGRVSGLASLGEARKTHPWQGAWRTLTLDAYDASVTQGDVVIDAVAKHRAEEARRN